MRRQDELKVSWIYSGTRPRTILVIVGFAIAAVCVFCFIIGYLYMADLSIEMTLTILTGWLLVPLVIVMLVIGLTPLDIAVRRHVEEVLAKIADCKCNLQREPAGSRKTSHHARRLARYQNEFLALRQLPSTRLEHKAPVFCSTCGNRLESSPGGASYCQQCNPRPGFTGPRLESEK